MFGKYCTKNIIVLLLLYMASSFTYTAVKDTTSVTFNFINAVKGIPIVLNDSMYTNSTGESYNIKNFKYYISNISLTGIAASGNKENYFLVDEANADSKSFSINIKPGTYTAVQFTLGVDSLHNVSGAQSGVLDPMNGMFWTWNSGYIMAKLEGSSSASNQVNQRFEYHIGGFSGVNNTVKKIILPLSTPLVIEAGKTAVINIETDVDAWWQNPHALTITQTPVCTTPGALAKNIADNYSKQFSIKTVNKN